MKFSPPLIILLLILISTVKSQTIDSTSFVPDRPGMATPPDILTPKSFQIEDGLQIEKYSDGIVITENYLFPSLLLRYGVLKNAEVRIQTDYVYFKEKDYTSWSTGHGFNPVTLGAKIGMVKQRTVLPTISLLINVTMPYLGRKEFRPASLAPSFCILMSNDITESLNICYNYGMSWNGSSSVLSHFYALCLGTDLTGKWSAFIEGYGFISQSINPEYYVDAGLAYLINRHLQLDFSAAGYLNSFTDYYLVNTGIAWKM